jgi:PAS domain S-box-containing protein
MDAEARFQAQHDRFRRIVQNTDAAYFRIGMDGCYEDVNPAWLRMYGFTRREDAIGLHFSAVQVPEDVAKAESIVEALVRGESVKSGEFSRLRRDGTIGYHSFSANPVLDGDRVIGIEGFLVDSTKRKLAAQELEQLQKVFSAAQLAAHFGAFKWNAKTGKTQWPPETSCLYGLDPATTNPSFDTWFQTVHTDDRDRVLREIQQTLNSPDGRLNFEYRSADGLRWIAAAGQVYRDPEGQPDYIVGIDIDITERKRAEETVRESEEHFRSLFQNMREGVAYCKMLFEGGEPQDFVYHSVNAAFEQLTGLKNVAGKRVSEVIPGIRQSNPELFAIYGRVTLTGKPEKFETYVGPLDIWFSVSVYRPQAEHFVAVFDNITERKRAEAAIQQANEAVAKAERYYRIIFNSGSDAVFVQKVGDDGLPSLLLEVNDNTCRYLGYTREELLRMRVFDIAAPEGHPNVPALTRRILTEGQLVWEGTHVAKDGRRIPVEINAHLFDLNGSPAIISSVRNIAERKEAETAKAKLEEQLRQAQKLESLGRLAGGVAHDFNNLLTVINGYNGLLLNQLKAFDPLRSYAAEIKNAGDRAANLTKQLLAFGRKQIIEPTTFDLNTTIRESAGMFQRLIGEDIALETHLDDSLGQVMADPHQIHQVIMNLVVNARDAMPDGGRLDIGTVNVDLGAENSAALHLDAIPGRYVLMNVTDSGHGMDEATRQHIFEPFFTTKEVGKGTGLGLATVYGILRQSGGWIDVWSEVGAGTSFKVYLPRVDGRPLPERDGFSVPAETGSETILVVEDQKAVRSFTKAALKQYGYHVVEASDGDEAIALARQYSGELHLLLTDVVLPGMNGKELSAKLTALRPNLKVLFISGYTADVIAHRGVLDRGVAFLNKPFSPGELATKVRDVLAGRSGPRD